MELNYYKINSKEASDYKDPHQLVDIKYISHLTGMTDKWFYTLIKSGLFPKPIKLGRASRWKLNDVKMWIDEKYKKKEA